MFDLEQLLGQLRGEDVAVVAFGQGEEVVGTVCAQPPQDVLLRSVGAHCLPRKVRLELVERLAVDIDDRDVVALPGQPLGQAGADAPTANDYRAHLFTASRR